MYLVNKAKEFAMLKHATQVRKYSGEPYIVHPIAVKDLLISFGIADEIILASALLHDTVEDTNTTIQELRKEFSDDVAELVWWLTDYKHDKEGNRETRKLITTWKLSCAPFGARVIKLADVIDNAKDIATNDPDFSKVFQAEKKTLLEVMATGLSIQEWKKMEDLYYEAEQKVK